MFNLSTQDVVLSIENASLVNLNGIYFQEYENFFGNNFSLPDISHSKFRKLEMQEDFSRQVLDTDDVVSRKLQIFFMNKKITDALSKKFDITLKFQSVDVWRDLPGYYLPPHTDNKSIKLALQIYLGDNDQGTCLYGKGSEPVHTFQFKNNFGYSLLNNEKSLHGVPKVKNNGRKSLYVRYS